MKQLLASALVAAIISGLVVLLMAGESGNSASGTAMPENTAPTAAQQPPPGVSLTVTDALPEDVWVNGSRQAGDDHRILTSAESSMCFITKIEISGITSPDDTSACSMQIDDFTGFWDLVVSVPEGSQSNVRCNARCLTWE